MTMLELSIVEKPVRIVRIPAPLCRCDPPADPPFNCTCSKAIIYQRLDDPTKSTCMASLDKHLDHVRFSPHEVSVAIGNLWHAAKKLEGQNALIGCLQTPNGQRIVYVLPANDPTTTETRQAFTEALKSASNALAAITEKMTAFVETSQ